MRRQARKPDKVYVLAANEWSKNGIACDVGKRWRTARLCNFAPGSVIIRAWLFEESAAAIEAAAHKTLSRGSSIGEWHRISCLAACSAVAHAAKALKVEPQTIYTYFPGGPEKYRT